MSSRILVDEIYGKTSGTSAMEIDGSGRVTLPAIPSFNLQGTNSGNKSVADDEVFGATDDGQAAFSSTSDGAFIQGGFTYDSATGEITIPIDGVYLIGGMFYMNQAASAEICIRVNDTVRARNYKASSTAHSMGIHIVLSLSANDKVKYQHETGATRTFYEGALHTYVYGHLVG